jgi:hypothetical protein
MRSARYSKQAKSYLTVQERKGKRLQPPEPYRSWLEADVAHGLTQRKIDFEYETKKITYVEPVKVRTYTPDLILCDGRLIIEVKGRWTAIDRRKMSEVLEQNPDLNIKMLFHKDNTISRNSRTRYSDWCRKRQIDYHIGIDVPQEWIDSANKTHKKQEKKNV